MMRPPTETASNASYQTYFAASAIRMTTTTAPMINCAVALFDRLFHRLCFLLSLCIVMMTSLEDAIVKRWHARKILRITTLRRTN